jgi:hypothetical protein
LSDPRIDRTKQHLLRDIIAIAILAVLSGSDSWVAIETYAQAKQEWLQEFLALANGIPSHDTIARVFARLDPQAFEQCFHRWALVDYLRYGCSSNTYRWKNSASII